MISSSQVKIEDLSKYNKMTLDKYIHNQNKYWLRDFIDYNSEYHFSVAVDRALEYLNSVSSGIVLAPETCIDNKTLLPYLTKLVKTTGKLNVEFYNNRFPINSEARPLLGTDFEVGDRIINTDILTNPCMGWVCIEKGTPGVWKEYGQIRKHYSELETLDFLPQESPLQIGRQVMLSNGDTGSVWVCKDINGTPTWVQQDYGVGDNSNRPKNPHVGMIRYNTDLSNLEWWTGNTWDRAAGTGDLEGFANVDEVNRLHLEVSKLLTRTADTVNVIELGATGDGETDDTESIQSALDLAKTNGLVNIYIPDGVYIISSPLQVFENTHLKLSNNAIIRRSFSGHMLVNGEVNGAVQYGNIHIEGGQWDMDNNHTVYRGGSHFTIGNADNITIENVKFLNNHGGHSLDIAGVHNLIVRDCQFLGFWINPSGDRDYVEAVQISEFTEAGQPVFAGGHNNRPSKNVLIENCKFSANPDNPEYGPWPVAVGHHSAIEESTNEDITIRDCQFIDQTYAAIRPFCWNNVLIENCKFENCREGVHITSAGKGDMSSVFVNHKPSNNTRILNCTFIGSLIYDIWSRGKFAKLSDGSLQVDDYALADTVLIQGCRFQDNISNTSIYMDMTKNVTVKDNIFSNVNRPIYLASCSEVNISNNIVESSINEGVFLTLTAQVDNEVYNKDIKVTSNTFKNLGRTGIFVRYVDRFVVSDNIVLNASLEAEGERHSINIAYNSANGVVHNNVVEGTNHKFSLHVANNCKNVKCTNNQCESTYNFQPEILFLGDSITYGEGLSDPTTQSYPSVITSKYQVGITNEGVSSMRFYHPTDTLNVQKHVLTISNLDRYKTVSIALGTNDWRYNTVFGTKEDHPETTVWGGLTNLIAYLREQNPTVNIVVFSPLYRKDTTEPNQSNLTLEQFCTDLKQVADYNGVKYVDMYHTSGICEFNVESMTTDLLHPNESGYKLLAPRFYHELVI